MGFSFLTPLFAIGAAAIAVPVLVHLVHKERKEATLFPSLMFLRRTPYQHSRRQRIRDWWLFALRALAVLLLVAAFSRPVFSRVSAAAPTQAGGHEVVLLVDQSLSMRYADRWTRATDAAHRVIDGLGVRDRATIILFDDAAHAVNEATGDHAVLRAAIDSARPTDGSTRYAPAMTLARRIVAGSRLPKREVMVVSDFQRSGWDLTEEARLPTGTEIQTTDVAQGEVHDRAVRSVELRRATSGRTERIAVSVRVSNAGPASHGVEARLEVGGRTVQTSRFDVAADAGGLVTFSPVPVPQTPQRAAVRLAPDALKDDDSFSFILERAPSVGVLVVQPAQAPADRVLYLQRALEIGDRPSFDLSVRTVTQLSPNDFTGKKVVILNDAGFPSGEAARRLERFVRGGGGLIVALGEMSGPRSWPAGAQSLLPAPVTDPIDRLGERGAILGFIDRSHPALALFSASRSGDLSAARFFRYRPIPTDSGVLARFDDGSAALAERQVGRGRVLEWASSFDALWNDLPRQPVFLPFVHQLVQYGAGYRAQRSVYEVGDAVDLSAAGSDAAVADTSTHAILNQAFVAVAPSGARLRIGGEGNPSALLPREAGIYEVRREGAPGELPRLVAVNLASRELEFGRFDPTRLTNAVAPAPGATAGAAQTAAPDPAARERQQSLWWYLLLIVTCLLVGESILADRISRRRPAVS
jgi:Aerotolerance regulator N-terminal/von Willebrand factor type A domain